jgi:large subunit ribosomal protein L27
MSHVKSGGTAKNLRDSNPKYLGVKIYAGQKAKNGSIIVRQRGTKILAGKNTLIGKDHTIFAKKDGIVTFTTKRKKGFNQKTTIKKVANIS